MTKLQIDAAVVQQEMPRHMADALCEMVPPSLMRAALQQAEPQAQACHLHLKPPFEDENGNDISGEYIALQAHREAMEKLEKLANDQAEINAKMTREKYPFVHLRMDVSEAEKESALRNKLLELGWASPEATAKKDAALKESELDASRYRWLRKGNSLTVVVPTPTDKKPNSKVTIITGNNPESQYGDSLDAAIDAAITQAQGAMK